MVQECRDIDSECSFYSYLSYHHILLLIVLLTLHRSCRYRKGVKQSLAEVVSHESDLPCITHAHYAMDMSSSNSNLWPAVRARDYEANRFELITPYARVMSPNDGFHEEFLDDVSYDDF